MVNWNWCKNQPRELFIQKVKKVTEKPGVKFWMEWVLQVQNFNPGKLKSMQKPTTWTIHTEYQKGIRETRGESLDRLSWSAQNFKPGNLKSMQKPVNKNVMRLIKTYSYLIHLVWPIDLKLKLYWNYVLTSNSSSRGDGFSCWEQNLYSLDFKIFFLKMFHPLQSW